jgi:hypothetical protein
MVSILLKNLTQAFVTVFLGTERKTGRKTWKRKEKRKPNVKRTRKNSWWEKGKRK